MVSNSSFEMASMGSNTNSWFIKSHYFIKLGHSRSFLFIFVFSIQLVLHKYFKFVDDWIWTVDLWCWTQLLYQLSHNRCPVKVIRWISNVGQNVQELPLTFDHERSCLKLFLPHLPFSWPWLKKICKAAHTQLWALDLDSQEGVWPLLCKILV